MDQSKQLTDFSLKAAEQEKKRFIFFVSLISISIFKRNYNICFSDYFAMTNQKNLSYQKYWSNITFPKSSKEMKDTI